MASTGERSPNGNSGLRREGCTKRRHKFTKEQVQELCELFHRLPYPDFTSKEELAIKFHCSVHVISNWFQNKRAKLPPAVRHRIFARWKHQFYLPFNHQGVQAAAPSYARENFPRAQNAQIASTDWSSLEKQGNFSQQMYFNDKRYLSYALGSEDDTGNEHSPGTALLGFNCTTPLYPSTISQKDFDKDESEAKGSQHEESPCLLQHAFRECDVWQKEEQKMMPIINQDHDRTGAAAEPGHSYCSNLKDPRIIRQRGY